MCEFPNNIDALGELIESNYRRISSIKLILWVLSFLVLFTPTLEASQEDEREKVLVLFTFRSTLPASVQYDRGLRSVFEKSNNPKTVLNIEFMDLSHHMDNEHSRMLRDVYRIKYSDPSPDLIIAVAQPAVEFVLKHREDLFPGVPVVFGAVEKKYTESRSLGTNITGYLTGIGYTETLELALQLQPDIRNVVVFGGAGSIAESLSQSCRDAYQAYEKRLNISYLMGLPMNALLDKVSNLPEQSIVLELPVWRDGAGKEFVGNEALAMVAASANAPAYSFWDVSIGTGIVGGYVHHLEEEAKAVARLGLRILNGEKPESIPIKPVPSFKYMFDWRQLKRWSISEDRLPPGSVVKFKELTTWDRYKGRIIAAIALMVFQVLIISYLLYQRRIRRKVEQNYRTVADYTYDWEYWSNMDGTLEYVSPSCQRISGYSVQQFKENPGLLRKIIVQEDKNHWKAHRHKAEKQSRPGQLQFRIQRKDGEIRWIEHVCQPVTDSQGGLLGFRASNRDITERKQAEFDAQRHRAELTHVSRITTLGELSASLAHELNQPLTAILSNAQAARRFLTGELTDPDEVNEILNDIIDDDKRAADMIKRLRALMQRKDLEFNSLDLNHVIRGVAKLVNREVFIKDVPLVLELANGLPHVQGDAIHLEQVILNLILNGTEAMETIDHQFRELRILTVEDEENAVRVSVRDKGTGIDHTHIDSIFEAFYTTKPEGMGMGLSICRSIIEAHGGRLWAENNPDKGATVFFTVPISKGDKA